MKDTLNNIAPQGKPVNDEYAISFIFKNNSSTDVRKASLVKLSNRLSKQPATTRVRYHLLEDYDDINFPETTVRHRRPAGVRYNAWIELGVKSGTDPGQILETDLRALLNELDTIHVYPIFDKYTIIANGKATIVGLKGYPAYQTILAAGAENQLNPGLLEDVYGRVPKE